MHNITVSVACGIALFAAAAPSMAVTQSRLKRVAAGPACQLSIPTTDTQVRPKAAGFRNEGTKSEFVICQLDTPDGDLTYTDIYFGSIDGVPHTVDCTGVNGHSLFAGAIAYSSKSVSTDASGSYGFMSWTPADFGGAGPGMPFTGFFSITCTLPAKTFIGVMGMQYSEDVGT